MGGKNEKGKLITSGTDKLLAEHSPKETSGRWDSRKIFTLNSNVQAMIYSEEQDKLYLGTEDGNIFSFELNKDPISPFKFPTSHPLSVLALSLHPSLPRLVCFFLSPFFLFPQSNLILTYSFSSLSFPFPLAPPSLSLCLFGPIRHRCVKMG